MISIIVCSRNQTLTELLKVNIRETIGLPFELIIHDNSMLNEGISAVYNRAGNQARFPLICFVHEDVVFRTAHWGEKLLNHFQEADTGVIGVAGGDSMSRVPNSWSNSFFSKYTYILQHSRSENHPVLIQIPGKPDSIKQRALTIDGVFLAVKRSVFEQYKFDEMMLKGFHGYDIDYSLQVTGNFKNYVIYDILIEHYSEGRLDRNWLESTFLVAQKWKSILPLSVFALDEHQWTAYHWQSLHLLLNRMFDLSYHPVYIYMRILRHAGIKHLTARRFLSMNRLFFQLLMNSGAQRRVNFTDSLNNS